MRITKLSAAAPRPRRIAVGTFDGVHLGHRRVIEGSDSVLTFEPHPVSVVAPEHTPRLLTTLEHKAELLQELSVQELIVIDFTAEFAARSADSFIHEVLEGALCAQRVSVGENFRFGHRAQGTPESMAAAGDFQTVVAPLLEVDGEVVSSSHIRALLSAGEVAQAARLLGNPFELRGQVVHGDGRGRTLGFPTANLVPDERLICPGHGVYACQAQIISGGSPETVVADSAATDARSGSTPAAAEAGQWLPAAVSIGVRPTFITGRGELIEAYLLDYEGDLYDSQLRVRFLERLRGERRFASAQELIDQMHLDVKRTREAIPG